MIDHLPYIERRLAELELEEQEAIAGIHPSVTASMQEGQSQAAAIDGTLTVIRNIREHLLMRQRQYRATQQSH